MARIYEGIENRLHLPGFRSYRVGTLAQTPLGSMINHITTDAKTILTSDLMPTVIFHADDLGLTSSFNRGILKCATQGMLTSVSICVNGPVYRDAVEEILPQVPHLGVGVHLNLIEGATLRSGDHRTSILCHPDGRFRLGFGGLYFGCKNKRLLKEVEAECRCQIEAGFNDLENLDHIDSHLHAHSIGPIFEIVARLAKEYGIPYVRIPDERFFYASPVSRHLRPWYPLNLLKFAVLKSFSVRNRLQARRCGVRANDRFMGLLYSGYMDPDTLITGIRSSATSGEVLEVLLHPAVIQASSIEEFLTVELRDYVVDPARASEIGALTDPDLPGKLAESGIHVTNYRDLNAGVPPSTALDVAAAGAPEPERTTVPLRTYVFLDETPFHHPEYLRRIHRDCHDVEVIGVAIVKSPKKSNLQRYLLHNWRQLGFFQFVKLGMKRVLYSLAGILPASVRGDFDGSVKAAARRCELPIRHLNSLNDPGFMDELRASEPDVIVSSNSLIFNDEILNLPRLGCINRHSALLPRYGGIFPVFRAIQYGERFVGASVHQMVRGIDEGSVISRKWLPLFPGDTVDKLYRLCFVLSFEATADSVRALRLGRESDAMDEARKEGEREGLSASYHSFPTAADWVEFKRRGGQFI